MLKTENELISMDLIQCREHLTRDHEKFERQIHELTTTMMQQQVESQTYVTEKVEQAKVLYEYSSVHYYIHGHVHVHVDIYIYMYRDNYNIIILILLYFHSISLIRSCVTTCTRCRYMYMYMYMYIDVHVHVLM